MTSQHILELGPKTNCLKRGQFLEIGCTNKVTSACCWHSLACTSWCCIWVNLRLSSDKSSCSFDFCLSQACALFKLFFSRLAMSWQMAIDSAALSLAASISARNSAFSFSSLRTAAFARSTWPLAFFRALSISESFFMVLSSSAFWSFFSRSISSFACRRDLSSAKSLLSRRAACITFCCAHSVRSWSWVSSSCTRIRRLKTVSSFCPAVSSASDSRVTLLLTSASAPVLNLDPSSPPSLQLEPSEWLEIAKESSVSSSPTSLLSRLSLLRTGAPVLGLDGPTCKGIAICSAVSSWSPPPREGPTVVSLLGDWIPRPEWVTKSGFRYLDSPVNTRCTSPRERSVSS